MVHHGDEYYALAHNGNLINAPELWAELEEKGSIFQSTMDSEVIVHLMAPHLKNGIEEALTKALARVQGAYSIVMLTRNRVIAVRDPRGFRPLSLGRFNGGWVVASETCAFDLVGAKYIRDVQPGEIIIIDEAGLHSLKPFPVEKPSHCIFELIYFSRPDSQVFGENVYLCRKRLGHTLAREYRPDVDFVMPFPDSGNYAALGYAEESRLPFEMGMIRNHYVGRTFIQPSQAMRDFGVRVKAEPGAAAHRRQKDRHRRGFDHPGTTSRNRVRHLRECGVKEIHMVVSCPPTRHPCPYGIDFSMRGELIAAEKEDGVQDRVLHRPRQPALPLPRRDGPGHRNVPGKFLPRLLHRRLPAAAPGDVRKILLRGSSVLKRRREMGLMTRVGYIESLRKLKPTVYMFGQKVEDVVDNPRLRAGIEATGATYELAEAPEYRDLILTHSKLIDEPVNRFNNPPASIADLVARVKINRLLGRRVGTCFQRCTGQDCMAALSVTTYDVDRKYGTDYNKRFLDFLKYMQKNDFVANAGSPMSKGTETSAPRSSRTRMSTSAWLKKGGRDRRARRQVPSDRFIVGARDHCSADARPAQRGGGIRGGLRRSDRHSRRDSCGRPVESGHAGAGRLRLRQPALFQIRPDGYF